MIYRNLVFPVLTTRDTEDTHEKTLKLMALASESRALLKLLHLLFSYDHPKLRTQMMGLDFPNPIGIAAGFDKNGIAIPALAALGFGSGDIGTIPPLAQPGNERPRIHRLIEDWALINSLGFNSQGSHHAVHNIGRNLFNLRKVCPNFVLSINIGANKISIEQGKAVEDYCLLVQNLELMIYADLITVNISSPNTAKLRELQGKDALYQLLSEIKHALEKLGLWRPILVKIAPDLDDQQLDDILDVALSIGIDGIVTTNTTIARPNSLRSKNRDKPGGLSGRPLLEPSTKIQRYVYQHTEGKLPITGVGGVFTAEDALYKIFNGASLVQAYTGFVYEGPSFPGNICRGIVRYLEKEGVKSIGEMIGSAL